MSTSNSRDTLVMGTRGSMLARRQTEWVADRMRAAHPGIDIRTEIIVTTGDEVRDQPLPAIGGKGLFTDRLEQALRDGAIDVAVHSAKDLPTALGEGLDILAFPAREDPRDVWVSHSGTCFDDLPEGSVIGTTSLRRQAQLLMRRPDVRFVGLRGNVDTRIRKVHRGDCAGAVLAMAGLKRSDLAGHATHPFEPELMLPAPGQGALALEGRAGDERVQRMARAVHDEATCVAVGCERAILAALEAGCRAPVAILAVADGHGLRCDALVSDPDGRRQARARAEGPAQGRSEVIEQIVADLRAQGADAIIAACRHA